jgi:hypothetical protein
MSAAEFDPRSLTVDERAEVIERIWFSIAADAKRGDQRAAELLDMHGPVDPELLVEAGATGRRSGTRSVALQPLGGFARGTAPQVPLERRHLIQGLWESIEESVARGEARASHAVEQWVNVDPEIPDALVREADECDCDPSSLLSWQTLLEPLKRKDEWRDPLSYHHAPTGTGASSPNASRRSILRRPHGAPLTCRRHYRPCPVSVWPAGTKTRPPQGRHWELALRHLLQTLASADHDRRYP